MMPKRGMSSLPSCLDNGCLQYTQDLACFFGRFINLVAESLTAWIVPDRDLSRGEKCMPEKSRGRSANFCPTIVTAEADEIANFAWKIHLAIRVVKFISA